MDDASTGVDKARMKVDDFIKKFFKWLHVFKTVLRGKNNIAK